jgi:hypothetical protein
VFVALGIQHARRMRLIMLSCVASLAVPYFSTLSHKLRDFRGEKIYWTQNVCFWFSLQMLSEISFILTRTERDIIITVHISVCMYSTGYCWQILMKLEFSRRVFLKIIKYKILWKPSTRSRIVPFVADGQMHRHNQVNSLFSLFFLATLLKKIYDKMMVRHLVQNGLPSGRVPLHPYKVHIIHRNICFFVEI